MRKSIGLLVLLALPSPASALTIPPPTAPIKTETVSFKSGKETASGFLVAPGDENKHAALIVIHEWWGLNDWVKNKAKSFAEKGYVTIAVDLYRGQSASDADTAHQLMRGLPEDRALADLKAAFAMLAARKDVDAKKIAVVGWCMGGGYSLALAMNEPRLAGAAMYYGRLATDAAAIGKIRAPLLGNFGADDKGISADSVKAFEATAKAKKVAVDFKIYPGAGHAFASSPDGASYRAEAAQDADARADAFLAKVLKR